MSGMQEELGRVAGGAADCMGLAAHWGVREASHPSGFIRGRLKGKPLRAQWQEPRPVHLDEKSFYCHLVLTGGTALSVRLFLSGLLSQACHRVMM